MKTLEINFDGLVGPTHHYAGLATGDLASEKNAHRISHPKAAALQGLQKMKLLLDLKIPQALLPPQERPALHILRNLGFSGTDVEVLTKASKVAPAICSAIYSASSMWAANAATVSPSVDSKDKRVHFTPANLVTHFHRAIEAKDNYQLFKTIFADERYFVVHFPLFSHSSFADEGAANHNRLCSEYGELGYQIFVYGRDAVHAGGLLSYRYPQRQSLEGSEAIARLHQLQDHQYLFVKQNLEAIEQGVFHNDVISVMNKNVFLYHESAFENTDNFIKQLKTKISYPIYCLGVSLQELSVQDAVSSYLFNSQLISIDKDSMALIAPIEAQENKAAHQVLRRLLQEDNPIQTIHFVDCRESMLNGGGPACLRLRVVLTDKERNAIHPQVFLNEALYHRLVKWVERHYRDELAEKDLLDPHFLQECHTALDELTRILKLGSFYNFQKI